jgi:tetratricopeptide (TPR) repeat protein
LFPLALSHEKKGSHDEAIGTYEIILEKNPDLDAAANNLAALLSDFRFDDPKMLERALELTARFQNSDNAFFLDTLGWIYYRMNEYDRSLSLIGKAAELQGDIPQIQYHLGMVLKALGKHDQARQALQKAVSSESGYPGIEEARATLSKLP